MTILKNILITVLDAIGDHKSEAPRDDYSTFSNDDLSDDMLDEYVYNNPPHLHLGDEGYRD